MVKLLLLFLLAVQNLAAVFFRPVYAGSLNNAKITISDSRAGYTPASHTFDFTTSTVGTVANITFEYCTAPSGACTVPAGLDTTNAVQQSPGGIGAGSSNLSSNGTIYFNVDTPVSVSSGVAVTIPYSTVTNPTGADSTYFVRISTRDGVGNVIDNTVVGFAILSPASLTVSATVGSTFAASIAPVTSGTVNGRQINLAETSADSIPFGLVNAGSSKVAAHDITVSTNAGHGYEITVRTNDPPLSSGSNKIDKFTGINLSPTDWSAPSGVTSNTNSGFFGYTTEDISLCTGTGSRFANNKWAGPDMTPYEIVCNPGGTIVPETTRVGWQLEVNEEQPSGLYTGTVILVITPVY